MSTRFEDFTFYDGAESLVALYAEIAEHSLGHASVDAEEARRYSRDRTLRITVDRKPFIGRALVCPCYNGKHVSVTVRVSARADLESGALNWPRRPVKVTRAKLKALRRWPADRRPASVLRSIRATLKLFPDCHPDTTGAGDVPIAVEN